MASNQIIEDFTAVNFTSGGLKEVRGIVIHSMDGFHKGTISWFRNPQSGASAHYLISKEGEIRQMVREQDMAWHAGRYDEGKAPSFLLPNPNWYTLGIELEDEGKADWKYTDAQKQATAWLVDLLLKKYRLAQNRVFLHKELNPSRRSDPQGDFSRDWLFNKPPVGDLPPVADQTQRIEQIIIDGYKALTGANVTDSEKKWRLETWENTVKLLESLTGDGRFYNKYVAPHITAKEEGLKEAHKKAINENNELWQSRVNSAKKEALEELTAYETLTLFFSKIKSSK